MNNSERRQITLIVSDGRQRHLNSVGSGNKDALEVGWVFLKLWINFQNDLVLIALGINYRNLPLRERVVECVVDILNPDSKAGCLFPVALKRVRS